MSANGNDDGLRRLRFLLSEALGQIDTLLETPGKAAPDFSLPRERPALNLSHLHERSAIPAWLDKYGPASPAEIRRGLGDSGVKITHSTQQQIFQLAREGKIRKVSWGLYDAVRGS